MSTFVLRGAVAEFLDGNRAMLVKNHTDYIEAMIESDGLESMQSFPEWVEQEWEVARREGCVGAGEYK